MSNFYNPYASVYQAYPQYQAQPAAFAQQPQQYQQSGQAPMQPQIQNGGFMSVRSEIEAFNYPVALGTSITFKDENAPFIYVKTRDFSQLKEPVFEKYRLVKEDVGSQPQAEINLPLNPAEFATHGDVDALRSEIENLKAQFAVMTTPTQSKTQAKTKEVKKNDET